MSNKLTVHEINLLIGEVENAMERIANMIDDHQYDPRHEQWSNIWLKLEYMRIVAESAEASDEFYAKYLKDKYNE